MTEQESNGVQGRPAVTMTVSVILAIIFGFAAGLVANRPEVSSVLGLFPAGSDQVSLQSEEGMSAVGLAELSSRLEESRRIEAVESATPAVVSVVVSKDMPVFEQYYSDPFGGLFGDLPGLQVPQMRQKGTERQDVGAGTGFFVSADGLIVTNRHVVADEAADYTVITADGEKHEAKVMGRDPSNDLAVLKIEAEEGQAWPFLPLSENEPKVGQSVVAIGYALGQFSNTVSAGIVSGLARDITAGDGRGNSEQLYDVIQTDAAINPGNSGGPLLDLDGRVVGVNVAVEQGAQSVGFALPASDIRRVVDSVMETGRISRPFLGVRYVMINEELKESNQLPVDYGALVARGDRQTDLAVTP
ncbi:MAG: trypsin-like peptidase domain-containing protein, partial [bacterium]